MTGPAYFHANVWEPAPEQIQFKRREGYLQLDLHQDVWITLPLHGLLEEQAEAMRRLSVLANQAAEELETAAGAP